MLSKILKNNLNFYKSSRLNFEQINADLYNQRYKDMQKKALQSKTVQNCFDTFESFYKKEFLDKRVDVSQGIAYMFSLAGLLINSSAVVLALAGSLNPGISLSLGVVGTSFAFASMRLTQKIQSLLNSVRATAMYENDNASSDFFYMTSNTKVKNIVKSKKTDSLIYDLNCFYPQSSIEKQKIENYIKNNYSEYYWNKMLSFCIKNCQDNSDNPNYENFLKLTQITGKVYEMLDFYFNPHGRCLNYKNRSGEIFYNYQSMFSREMFSLIPVEDLKDKDGKLDDIKIEQLYKIYEKGPHGLSSAFSATRNADNSLNWDAINSVRKTNRIIRDGLYSDGIKYNDGLIDEILYQIIENCYNLDGKVEKHSLNRLNEYLEKETTYNGIRNNSILRNMLSSELLCKIEIQDIPATTVKDAVNSVSKLYNIYKSRNVNVLSFLDNISATPNDIYNFLCHMTANETTAKKLVKNFSSNPREANYIYQYLIKRLGDNRKAHELFNSWYYDEINGYKKAYTAYYEEEILSNVTDLKMLVKQSPNIAIWAFNDLIEKTKILPEIGEIPVEFGNKNDFLTMINKLKKKYCSTKENQQQGDNFVLRINKKEYEIQPLTNGCSLKLIFKIIPFDNPDKSYILKFAPYINVGSENQNLHFNENQALRADMPYSLAMIDFYLKENNSPNAPDIKYYDHKNQAILYEATKGEYSNFNDEMVQNLFEFRKNIYLSDVYNLGILLNDVKNENFIKSSVDGAYKVIDSGHAKFENIFRPMIKGKHYLLGNLCGRELD